MKKLLSLSILAMLVAALATPAALASVKFDDGEVDLGSDSNLSSSELSRCDHYPTENKGDDDDEIGVYVCSSKDEIDFEDLFDDDEIEEIVEYYADEYDYYYKSNTRSSYSSAYRAPTRTVTPSYPSYADDTRVCTYQPTADGIGQYLNCTSLQDGDQSGYAYYDQAKIPQLRPYPSYVPYSGGYYPYY